ncbi:MAG TPA: hypothetical protein DCM07_33740 [Planctomycetaceae bacterium]|nr:hypothetical protein [Gimesia sp.]HAH49716.1 hypothetical protein [Planctomycetaceae bacterium]HBL45296.1 hypothetical protein [Planctomycetaceae bacterium]
MGNVIEVDDEKFRERASIDQAGTVNHSSDHGAPAKTIRLITVLRALRLDWSLFLVLRILILFFRISVMATGCTCSFLNGYRFSQRSSTRSQTYVPTWKIGTYNRQEGH